MTQPYSQTKALFAIARASFKAIFKSPQATFFSLFFPIVLIVIFASIGRGGSISFDIAVDKKSDTTNQLYNVFKHAPIFNIVKGDSADIMDRLKKGRISALLSINKTDSGRYEVHIISTTASQRELPQLQQVLNGIINEQSIQSENIKKIATVSTEVMQIRPYRMIDFYLPGMIGFSLIGSAVFGVAFVFFNLRQTLVLKRMYASPVSKSNIVIGESIGRVLFQMITVIVLILFGKYFYQFTLANGFITFLEVLVLSIVGLTVFMGFGFFVSSVAKNQNVIPIYANLFMFPQYFLSGTFFPKNFMPQSIQWLQNILPLTALNDSLRKVAFEGLHLSDCWKELGILAAWGVIIYFLAIRVFKWE
jgi:ABC-2 type transport system permease protein